MPMPTLDLGFTSRLCVLDNKSLDHPEKSVIDLCKHDVPAEGNWLLSEMLRGILYQHYQQTHTCIVGGSALTQLVHVHLLRVTTIAGFVHLHVPWVMSDTGTDTDTDMDATQTR
jgi:hypothetical protein